MADITDLPIDLLLLTS